MTEKRAKEATAAKTQLSLIKEEPIFPSTRFQGSKLKIVGWIYDALNQLDFRTALDAFGGTGCVSHMLKQKGKVVTYNDIMKFNYYIGLALIENSNTTLSERDVEFILTQRSKNQCPVFVSNTFKDIYFTDDENHWIDMVVSNISKLDDIYRKALAYFALFQACIVKRPFNLFHRKNLYLRLSDVQRSFGNKTTWDTPFEIHFRRFVDEANRAVFSNGQQNTVLNADVFDIDGKFDLVYIDTPYISLKGMGVDYLSFYHFLEGLVNYPLWADMIDYRTKHRRLKTNPSVWIDKKQIHAAFDRLFEKFKSSVIVVSYRTDGIPSVQELRSLLKKHKREVRESRFRNYRYVLSTNDSDEMLLIGL